jgi:hypothetical protein
MKNFKKSLAGIAGAGSLTTTNKDFRKLNFGSQPKLKNGKILNKTNKVMFTERRKKVQLPNFTGREKSLANIHVTSNTPGSNNMTARSFIANNRDTSGNNTLSKIREGNYITPSDLATDRDPGAANLIDFKKKKEMITLSAHKFNNVTINNTYNTNIKTDREKNLETDRGLG